MVSFRAPTPDDILHIGENMRRADINEVYAAAGRGPCEALFKSQIVSETCYTAEMDGEPFAMFGLARRSLISDVGFPWLLGTDRITENYRALIPLVDPQLQKIGRNCRVLRNHVHAANTAARRWLRFAGFTIHPAQPFGKFGEDFCAFEMELDHV